MENKTVIGILGGMGPEATADLFQKIIQATPVTKDQEHYRVIIDSNPKIPDRTQAILYGGESPVPKMVETAKNLEKSGAELILVPCMTSGYFLKEVQEKVKIPVIDTFSVLSAYLQTHYPHIKKLGVMATSGTKKTELFTKRMPLYEIIYPTDVSQEQEVMKAIYGINGIKQGNLGAHPRGLLKDASDALMAQGAEAVIAGCTVISLAFNQENEGLPYPLVNPMKILADYVTSDKMEDLLNGLH